MIRVDDTFEFAPRSPYGWELHHTRPSSKNPGKTSTAVTYHANLQQIADAIIERSANRCQSMEELKHLLATGHREIYIALTDKYLADEAQENDGG